MASDRAKKMAAEQHYNNQRANGYSTPAANRGGCGCPVQYSQTPGRFSIPRSFPINSNPNCASPLGGFAEAKALAGYTKRAGQVEGGVDQPISNSTAIVADAGVKSYDTGSIPLPSTDGIVSQTAGLKIIKLSLQLSANGAGKDAFSADDLFNSGTLFVRQGKQLLYQTSLFKLKVTDFGRLGFDVQIDPERADFNGVTFQLIGSVATNEADDYNIVANLTAQWG